MFDSLTNEGSFKVFSIPVYKGYKKDIMRL